MSALCRVNADGGVHLRKGYGAKKNKRAPLEGTDRRVSVRKKTVSKHLLEETVRGACRVRRDGGAVTTCRCTGPRAATQEASG